MEYTDFFADKPLMRFFVLFWFFSSLTVSVVTPAVIYSYRTYDPKTVEEFLQKGALEVASVGYWQTRFTSDGDKFKNCEAKQRVHYGCFFIDTQKVEEFKNHGFVGTSALWVVGAFVIFASPESEWEQIGTFRKFPEERGEQLTHWTSYMKDEHRLFEKFPNFLSLALNAASMAINGKKLSTPSSDFEWIPKRLPASVTQ